MQSYIVHAIDGRARLRHPLWFQKEEQEKALGIVRSQPGVVEATAGAGSILLILKDKADLAAICRPLEEAQPELLKELPSGMERVRQTAEQYCPCALRETASQWMTAASKLTTAGFKRVSEESHRLLGSQGKPMPAAKLERRTLLAVASLCVLLGFAGSEKAHVLGGGLFVLLATKHIWDRRKAL